MKVEEKILEIMNRYFIEKGINKTIVLSTYINREEGFDSLGFMQMIISIEDEYEIELDDSMDDIVMCNTVADLVHIVEKAM